MTIRLHSENSATRFSDHRGTAAEGWCVGMGVKVLLTMTALCALLVAAGGCGATEPEPPTTVVQSQPDPWTLPLEDRPPVFNPCEENASSRISEAGFKNPSRIAEADFSQSGGFGHSCSWDTSLAQVTTTGSWTSLEIIKNDPQQEVLESTSLEGMEALILKLVGHPVERACTTSIQTRQGTLTVTAVVNINPAERVEVSSGGLCDMTNNAAVKLLSMEKD